MPRARFFISMNILAIVLISVIALEHFYFMYLEMFLWNKPKGIKAFGLKSKSFANETKVLAANQGLYNGFLASGLLFGVFTKNFSIILFLLCCIIIAGIYGAYSTKNMKLFYIQSVPSTIVLIAILTICYYI